MTRHRPLIALFVALALALVLMLPLIWFINTTDWGILLMFLVPFAVFGLIRCSLRLADWAGITPYRDER